MPGEHLEFLLYSSSPCQGPGFPGTTPSLEWIIRRHNFDAKRVWRGKSASAQSRIYRPGGSWSPHTYCKFISTVTSKSRLTLDHHLQLK